MTLEIPSELYKTFQDILLQEAKRLCRDAAKVLGRPEKEVQSKVLKDMPKLSIQVIDDKDQPITCPVFVQRAQVIERCRHACLLGTGRCLSHQGEICIPEVQDQKPLSRIQPTDCMDTPLWCCEATHDVYTAEGKIVGRYKDETLRIYVLDASEV
jgi:hypothetical protein